MAEVLVGDKDRRAVDAGDVESLAGADTSDADLPGQLADAGKRDIGGARVGQVAVDLVTDDSDPIPGAQFGQPCQFLLRPDPSTRVLGVAEQQQRRLGVGQLLLQVFPVDGISLFGQLQRTFQRNTPVVPDRVEEDVVDRCHHHHFLGRGRQFPDQRGDGGNHPGGEDQPILLNGQTVAALPPPHIGVIPLVRDNRVPENPVLHALGERLLDFRSGLEVHVRHPHGQLPLAHVPFVRVGMPAVDDLVEVVRSPHGIPLRLPPVWSSAGACARQPRPRSWSWRYRSCPSR